MSERPILFNEPMVRAILDGTKTQTRRVVKFIPHMGSPDYWCHRAGTSDLERVIGDYRRFCPYGVPGDTLWVRETWITEDHEWDDYPPRDIAIGSKIIYRVNHAKNALGSHPWRPSIHMPRWASRIELEVIGVRVEQVQSISNDDAAAEGCPGYCHGDDGQMPWDEFRELWDSINAKRGYGWNENPWVWVVEFRRTK